MCRFLSFLLVSLLSFVNALPQDATSLVNKVKAKLDKVNDYEADGILRTDVSFIKIPVSPVNVYFKKPDHFRIKKEGGISILPKGGVNINISSLLVSGNFTAVAAGNTNFENQPVSIIKLIPLDEKSGIVLTTMYIDAKDLLVRKAITTTKENGTYEMELEYGKYSAYGLPDKVIFLFNTKDYKIPKGVTLEYEEDEKPSTDGDKLQDKKGRVEITYNSYKINKGIPDSFFQ